MAAIVARLDQLIDEGAGLRRADEYHVDPPGMVAWRTRVLAFLIRTLGASDTYSAAFEEGSRDDYYSNRDTSVAVLRNLRGDVEAGYLTNFYLGVAGEVLTDLLDIAAWSLSEGSKEAGAVLAGSALELGLRRVASVHTIDIRRARGIDDVNDALRDSGVYSAVRHGQVNAWRVLRNHAIHGDHAAYSDADVRLMLEGVRAFLAEQLR
jgi:hypothetical protein